MSAADVGNIDYPYLPLNLLRFEESNSLDNSAEIY